MVPQGLRFHPVFTRVDILPRLAIRRMVCVDRQGFPLPLILLITCINKCLILKKGRPVYIHALEGMKMSEVYKRVTPRHHRDTIVVSFELLIREILPAASIAAGKLVDQFLIVVDLKGLRCTSIPTCPFYFTHSADALATARGSSGISSGSPAVSTGSSWTITRRCALPSPSFSSAPQLPPQVRCGGHCQRAPLFYRVLGRHQVVARPRHRREGHGPGRGLCQFAARSRRRGEPTYLAWRDVYVRH
jgi:hypothetical protein